MSEVVHLIREEEKKMTLCNVDEPYSSAFHSNYRKMRRLHGWGADSRLLVVYLGIKLDSHVALVILSTWGLAPFSLFL